MIRVHQHTFLVKQRILSDSRSHTTEAVSSEMIRIHRYTLVIEQVMLPGLRTFIESFSHDRWYGLANGVKVYVCGKSAIIKYTPGMSWVAWIQLNKPLPQIIPFELTHLSYHFDQSFDLVGVADLHLVDEIEVRYYVPGYGIQDY